MYCNRCICICVCVFAFVCLYLHLSISGVLPFPVISGGLNSLLRLIVKTITSANVLGSYVCLYACIWAFALVCFYFLHFLYVCLYLIILIRVFFIFFVLSDMLNLLRLVAKMHFWCLLTICAFAFVWWYLYLYERPNSATLIYIGDWWLDWGHTINLSLPPPITHSKKAFMYQWRVAWVW